MAQHLPGSVLVDSSPWASERIDLSRVTHQTIDFEDYWTDECFDSVVLDPPWYYPALTNWINNASYFAREGSKILFPLFGEGTRPTADSERREILRICSLIGEVHLYPDAVAYETPRFELEALATCGVHMEGSWRLSDLVKLEVQWPASNLLSIRTPFEWEEAEVAGMIVAFRSLPRGPGTRSNHLIDSVPGVQNWVLDTVSRRDPRWQFINIWCSNNRVGYVQDTALLRSLLSAISAQQSAHDETWRKDLGEEMWDSAQQVLSWMYN